jgi:hypothetical protein
MRAAHDFVLLFGPGALAAENTIDLQCPEGSKYNASHWNSSQKRRNPRTMRNNAGAMGNTMRSNEATIVVWASGCNGRVDLAALGAWLALAGASDETKSASRAGREAQFHNSHLCH